MTGSGSFEQTNFCGWPLSSFPGVPLPHQTNRCVAFKIWNEIEALTALLLLDAEQGSFAHCLASIPLLVHKVIDNKVKVTNHICFTYHTCTVLQYGGEVCITSHILLSLSLRDQESYLPFSSQWVGSHRCTFH